MQLDISLYLLTDATLVSEETDFCDHIEQALRGGITLLQLREKSLETEAFVKRAKRLLSIARHYGVPLLINDRVDVCFSAGTDGVHIGQNNISVRDVRTLLGVDKVVGVTVSNVAQAIDAVTGGADYLSISALFETKIKKHPDDFNFLGQKGLQQLLNSFNKQDTLRFVPMVAIGGINMNNISQLWQNASPMSVKQLSGAAVRSTIMAAKDPYEANKILFTITNKRLANANRLAKLLEEMPKAINALSALRKSPSDRHAMNVMIMDENAHGTLLMGELLAIAYTLEEIVEMTWITQILVINFGNLSDYCACNVMKACKVANNRGIPVILDPIGTSAVYFQTSTCRQLLENVKFTIIKGYLSEIAQLADIMKVKVLEAEKGDSETRIQLVLK